MRLSPFIQDALLVGVGRGLGCLVILDWDAVDAWAQAQGATDIVVVGDGAGPLPWLPVQHRTPEAFSDPEWIIHPNGALGFIAVHAIADDPGAAMDALAKAWSAEGEEIFDGCAVVKTGAVELLIWSPSAYQNEYKDIEVIAPTRRPTVVGVGIAVERARPLQALLRANNVPFALAEGDRVLVAPEQAGGLLIEFLPQN